MKILTHKFATMIFVLLLGMGLHAQTLYTYNLDELGAVGSVATGVSATSLSRINGLADFAACPDGFNCHNWSVLGDFDAAGPAIEVTITADPGVTMTMTSLVTDLHRNNNGPQKMRAAYSTDGGATWVMGVDFNDVPNGSCFIVTTYTWDFADFDATGSVIFRFYGWDASNVNGLGSLHYTEINGFIAGCTPTTWYADADGDGYGDPAATVEACDAPDGYIADNTDCNDGNAAINPAATEICGNGFDDNCDGIADEGITASVSIDGASSVCAPLTVTLLANPTDAGNTYQWYRNGVVIAGATGSSYGVSALRGYYQAMVNHDFCSDLSDSIYIRTYDPNPPVVMSFAGTDLCINNPIKLKANYGFAPTHSYQWYLNDVAIAGATTAKYDATAAGSYYCAVFSEYPGCEYFSEAMVLTADGCRLNADAPAYSELIVYPNPSKGSIVVDGLNFTVDGSAQIIIYNTLGELAYTGSSEVVNGELSALVDLNDNTPNGVYYIIIRLGNETQQQQFIINK